MKYSRKNPRKTKSRIFVNKLLMSLLTNPYPLDAIPDDYFHDCTYLNLYNLNYF